MVARRKSNGLSHGHDGDPIFVADSSGRDPKLIFAAESGSHRHHLAWSPDGRFVYFVMGRPTTDEMDIWRIPVSAMPPVTPERITSHNARVEYPGVVGRSDADLFWHRERRFRAMVVCVGCGNNESRTE